MTHYALFFWPQNTDKPTNNIHDAELFTTFSKLFIFNEIKSRDHFWLLKII